MKRWSAWKLRCERVRVVLIRFADDSDGWLGK